MVMILIISMSMPEFIVRALDFYFHESLRTAYYTRMCFLATSRYRRSWALSRTFFPSLTPLSRETANDGRFGKEG
jgi:hypothetical protein